MLGGTIIKMSSVSVSFDWVKARAECSASLSFQELRLQVRADVKARDSRSDKDPRLHFSFNEGDANSFMVIATTFAPGVPSTTQSVSFVLKGYNIEIIGDQVVMFRASVALNNDGQCVFKINEEGYTCWQVRKMALEELFFGVV